MAAAFTLDNVSLHYSERELLSHISVTLNEGEKIGVVGLNGAGKSTLLKLLSGEEAPDEGAVSRKNGLTLSCLNQTPVLDPRKSITQGVLSSFNLNDTWEREGAAYEAKTILSRLGFTDFETPCGQLSGGQQKRVALAAVLCRPGDVMLLDEPTNHIDHDMIDWLEDYLLKYRGTLVMVTHDRYFLDRICNRILEVKDGRIENYQTNYEGYIIQKAQRVQMEAASLRKRQSLYKTELAWIQRGARARSTKAKGRIQQFDTLRQSLETQPEAAPLQMQSVASRLGKKILSTDHLTLVRGGRTLIKDFSYTFLRDDRIGIIGPNGAGKTSLLQALTGELAPEGGTVDIGETVKMGYFKQQYPPMPPETLLIDAVRNVATKVYTPDGGLSATQMLERFLFLSGCHYQQVARLSGGERRRLYLLQVLMRAPNILLLDEPTNDLDIETLTILEDYLDSFQGAVVAISHDRYFLDRVTRRLFALEDQRLTAYEGGYDAYRQAKNEAAGDAEPTAAKERTSKQSPRGSSTSQPKRRFTYKEQRDYDTIEETIAGLETALADVSLLLEAHSADYEKVTALMARQSQLEHDLETAMNRWLELQEIYEQIEKPKEE